MVHVFLFLLGMLIFTRDVSTTGDSPPNLRCFFDFGTPLFFIFSDPYYLAPECFLLDLTFKALIAATNSHLETEISDPANGKSCVWSFGIILLELCLVR